MGMTKYKYCIEVKKVVVYTAERFNVVASNQNEAYELAIKKAKENPQEFEVKREEYKTAHISVSCKPVEE